MQEFWDISPYQQLHVDNSPPSGDGWNLTLKKQSHTTFLLTQSQRDLENFPSDATRESIMSWANEEAGVGRYVGRCRVIDLSNVDHVILPKHLAGHLFGKVTRVLLKTKRPDGKGYAVLSPDAIRLLAACGVTLIGVDAESLDAPGSMTKESYVTATKLSLSLMFHMELNAVAPGEYELISLPTEMHVKEKVPEKASEKKAKPLSTTRAA